MSWGRGEVIQTTPVQNDGLPLFCRDVIKDEKMVDFFYYDVTGGKIEYNIAHAMGPNTSHSMAMETIVDKECPQQDEFE